MAVLGSRSLVLAIIIIIIMSESNACGVSLIIGDLMQSRDLLFVPYFLIC